MTSKSQAWLAGVDNSLDNFFSSGSDGSRSTLRAKTATRGTASRRDSVSKDGKSPESRPNRKRLAVAEKSGTLGGSPTKKPRSSGSKQAKGSGTSHCESSSRNREVASPMRKPKIGIRGKERRALGDVTRTVQNSPRRRRTDSSLRASPSKKKGKDLHGGDIGVENEDSLSDGEPIDDDVPLRLRASSIVKTPHPLKRAANAAKGSLLTPPPSSLPFNRALFKNRHDTPASNELGGSNSKKAVMQTPSMLSSEAMKKSYPTPASTAVPRFRLPPKSAQTSAQPPPTPNLHPDSDDSTLTSLSSSSPDSSQSDNRVDKEGEDPMTLNTTTDNHEGKMDGKADMNLDKGKGKDMDKAYTVIPSSQTQYIHYSPTKKRTYDIPVQMSTLRRKLFDPSVVIPSSQPSTSSPSSSQIISLSPRKARKPTPIVTLKGAGSLNFVVPTSQEDEREVRISEDDVCAAPQLHNQIAQESESVWGGDRESRSQDKGSLDHKHDTWSEGDTKPASGSNDLKPATKIHFIDEMLNDLQRLAEKAEMGIVTPSQVLSRPRVPLDGSRKRRDEADEVDKSSKKDGLETQDEDEPNQNDETRNRLFVQSSITEPDESQFEEDPFSLTNEAYARHIEKDVSSIQSLPKEPNREPLESGQRVPKVSTSPVTYTQSSETQPDSDDADPFPDLPPLTPSATAPPSTSTSTSTSTIDRSVVETLVSTKSREAPTLKRGTGCEESSQTEPESETESETQAESDSQSRTQADSQEEMFPSVPPSTCVTMSRNSPSIIEDGVEDEDEDEERDETINTLDVRRILGMDLDNNTYTDTNTTPRRTPVTRFRRRSVNGMGGQEEESMEEEDEEDEETIPTAVREFLAMFPQSQG